MGENVTGFGPNMRKLICAKMAKDAIPPGGGIEEGLQFLTGGKVGDGFRAAVKWCQEAIYIIKNKPNNVFGDEENIAGEILRRMDEKRRKRNIDVSAKQATEKEPQGL